MFSTTVVGLVLTLTLHVDKAYSSTGEGMHRYSHKSMYDAAMDPVGITPRWCYIPSYSFK